MGGGRDDGWVTRNVRIIRALLLTLGLLAGSALAISNDELLDAKEAFPAVVRATARDALEVQFRIAKGYYLYRDRLRFKTTSDAVSLGTPVLPKGKIKQDEFFGRVEVYRGTLKVKLPLTVTQAGSPFVLMVEAQGCADIGVCYPVFEQALTVELPRV